MKYLIILQLIINLLKIKCYILQKKINYITLEDVSFTDVDESMKFTYVKIESAHQIMIPEQASGSDAFTIIIDTVKMWEKLIHWYAKRTLRWLLMLITTVLGCFLLYNGFVEYSNFYTNHIDYSHHEENGNIVIDKIENGCSKGSRFCYTTCRILSDWIFVVNV